MANITTLAERIEKCVEVSGLTRNAYAKRCGVAQPRIFAIVHGKTLSPTIDVLARFCAPFGYSLDWLATGEGPMHKASGDMVERLKEVEAIGGLPSAKELSVLKMLRGLEKREPGEHQALIDKIMQTYVTAQED